MKLIKKFAVIVLLFFYSGAIAQNTDDVKKKGPDDSYARSSVSYLLLDFSNERFAPLLRNAINTTNMPSKFDNNDLKKKILPAPYHRGSILPDLKRNASEVISALTAEKYAIDLVKFWWKIRENGSYSTQLIAERGEYNATDFDFQEAMASKVGRARISDQGLKLIGNSYILVLDFHAIQTQDEIYDAQDAAARKQAEKDKKEFIPVKRIKNGFVGNLHAYLLQINYPDTVQGYFDDAFIDDKKIDMDKLNKIFDQVYSPFKLITTETQNVEGTQPNPGQFLAPAVQKNPEELMVVLVNNGITKSLNAIEKRVEAFRVKTPVTNTSPIRAKIGKKESLTHERRYFVWEYVGDKNNNVVAKKKGVIRARKVVDNRQDELGQTRESSFYQIGGGKITNGMTLQEAKDLGMGLSLGGGTAGFAASFDLNGFQYLDMPIKQFKLYVDIAAGGKELKPNYYPRLSTTFPRTTADFQLLKFSIGVQKEYPFMRNLHFAWYAGWGGESISWEDSNDLSESISASGFQFGAKFGINLGSPSFQLIGSFNKFSYGDVTYMYTPKDGEQQSDPLNVKMKDMFESKPSTSINLSLRLNF
jgi:hypothetical protein